MTRRPDLFELANRIDRFAEKIKRKEGEGFTQQHLHEDGSRTRYITKNIKSPEDYEDDMLHLATSLWSLKDYLKCEFRERGQDVLVIEQFIDRNQALKLCADIANRYKHRNLERSRSGLFPYWTRAKFTADGRNVRITFQGENDVISEIIDPQKGVYEMTLFDKDGNKLGELQDILTEAIKDWEDFIASHPQDT
jgi:hypothetical protein